MDARIHGQLVCRWSPRIVLQNGPPLVAYQGACRNGSPTGPGIGFGGARLVRTSGQLQMPGVPGVSGIQPLQVPLQPFDPPKLLGQLPLVNLGGGKAIPMAGSDGGVGVEYDYDQGGLKLRASGYMTMRDSGVSFFLAHQGRPAGLRHPPERQCRHQASSQCLRRQRLPGQLS